MLLTINKFMKGDFMSKIQIFALGGLNENGKNMYVVNVDDNIFVFDAGLKYPTANMLGVDYIIPKFDYLIDCCDTIVVKQELIRRCLDKKIKFISSMGTGNKFNPSLLEVCDIRKTSYDPIAKKIRKYLRDNNINGRVMVVYSKEINSKFVGSVPSMMFVPASAGILAANYVIGDIINI